MKPTSSPTAPVISAASQINFELLTTPLTPDERRQYLKKSHPIMWLLTFILSCFFLVPFYLALRESDPVMAVVMVAIILPLVLVFGIIALRKADERHAKIRRFAAVHGFIYNNAIRKPENQAGTLFHVRASTNTVRDTLEGVFQGRPFWIGKYRYTFDSGKSRTSYNHLVLRATLSRRVPHVMLDSRRNRVHLSPPFSEGEKLKLEGDFYKFYDVHVSKGYGADALYFLTPELMLALKELAKDFDIEFIDDKVYFYRVDNRSFLEPEALRALFSLLEGVIAEMRDNTRRYTDARAETPGVIATAGQRIAPPRIDLRHPSTYLTIILGIAFIGFYIAVLLNN